VKFQFAAGITTGYLGGTIQAWNKNKKKNQQEVIGANKAFHIEQFILIREMEYGFQMYKT
jgi:hypothetical protein